MNNSGLILKIIRQIEEKFNCITYAYIEENNDWWNICISNYDVYRGDEFKKLKNNWRIILNKRKIKAVFCYCNPIESNLIKLSNDNNLIMNV